MSHLCQCVSMAFMKTVRTTLRIEEPLKKAVEKRALDQNTTFQKLFNDALRMFVNDINTNAIKEIVFIDKAVDKNMNNLSRKDYYEIEPGVFESAFRNNLDLIRNNLKISKHFQNEIEIRKITE